MPQSEYTTAPAPSGNAFIALIVGVLAGFFGLLGYIAAAWGLHWMVACY